MLAENKQKRKLDGANQRLNPYRQADARPALSPLSAYPYGTFGLRPLHHWEPDAMLAGKGGGLRIASIHMAHNAHAGIVR